MDRRYAMFDFSCAEPGNRENEPAAGTKGEPDWYLAQLAFNSQGSFDHTCLKLVRDFVDGTVEKNWLWQLFFPSCPGRIDRRQIPQDAIVVAAVRLQCATLSSLF